MERANRLLELATRHVPKNRVSERTPGDAFGIWKNRDPMGIWDALPWKGEPKQPEPTPGQQKMEARREFLENRLPFSEVRISHPPISFGDLPPQEPPDRGGPERGR